MIVVKPEHWLEKLLINICINLLLFVLLQVLVDMLFLYQYTHDVSCTQTFLTKVINNFLTLSYT